MSQSDRDSPRTDLDPTLRSSQQERPLTQLPTLNHAIWDMDYVPADLRCRWLEQYSPALALVGLKPSDLKDRPSFWRARDRLPDPVLDGLFELRRLADNDGADLLADLIGDRSAPIVRNAWPMEVAVRARLDHHACFLEALRQRPIPTPAFTELPGCKPLKVDWSKTLHKQLHDGLVARLAHRGSCQLSQWTERGLHHFLILVAGCRQKSAWITTSHIRSFEIRGFTAYLVVLEPHTGALRIGPCDAATRSALAATFGELVAGDSNWFSERRVVRLERLAELGLGVLIPTKGLVKVKLVEMVLVRRGTPLRHYVERDTNALERLQANPLRCGIPRSVTFALQSSSDGRWQHATLSVPHQVAVSWRLDQVARRFFEARGLLGVG